MKKKVIECHQFTLMGGAIITIIPSGFQREYLEVYEDYSFDAFVKRVNEDRLAELCKQAKGES